MALPPLSKEDIRKHTAGGSFERGQEYFSGGAVRSLEQTGEHTLRAKVQGSDVHPYLVSIRFNAEEVTNVRCTCPYHGGSWCKHIVAALLKALSVDEVPLGEPATVADLTEGLDRKALVSLIERLVEHDPRLIDQLERECARLGEPSA
ncbi:MAG: SWIM zinc finger domain-containing protein [Salinivenus sp.]